MKVTVHEIAKATVHEMANGTVHETANKTVHKMAKGATAKGGVHKAAKVKVHETAMKNNSERDGESEGARQRIGAQRDGEGQCLTCSAVCHRSSYKNNIF